MTDTEKLTLLKRERGTLRQRFTKFKTFVEGLDSELSPAKTLALEERVKNITAAFDRFQDVQNNIEMLSVDDDETDAREEVENIYYEVIGEANLKIGDRVGSPVGSSASAAARQIAGSVSGAESRASGNAESVSGSGAIHDSGIRLPTIELSTFDGKYEQWIEFKELFESLINGNSSLSTIQKYHYLRASLKGEASEIIKCFDFSASNYELAWKSLNERYDNTKLMIHNHLRNIFEQTFIRRDNFCEIRQCIDTTLKNIRALKNLGEPTDSWDTMIIFVLCSKLDRSIVRDWEQRKVGSDSPKLTQFIEFLKSRADMLETWSAKEFKVKAKVNVAVSKMNCAHCNDEHTLYKCSEFAKLDIDARLARVKELKLCLGCLSSTHWIGKCKINKKCFKCQGRHNTLLHREKDSTIVATTLMKNIPTESLGILATAQVWVCSEASSSSHKGKVLMDCGSQSNLITENFARQCGAKFSTTDITIVGVGSKESRINRKCTLKLKSVVSDFSIFVEFLIVKSITEQIPSPKIVIAPGEMPKKLALADPDFMSPNKVDMLLGSSVFWDLLQPEKLQINDSISLQGTMFGWLVVGRSPESNTRLCFLSNIKLTESVRKFFENESISEEKVMSLEERKCEDLFVRTTTVGSDGRFIVKIPLKESVEKLGESREIAVRRFKALERRLEAKPEIKAEYVKFMREFQTLGHMTEARDLNNEKSYYMPHHCVMKLDSDTTKLRVVFDASAASSSGVSLNDIQCVGPTVQNDMFAIIVRFRQHEFVWCADVEKMFRQIWVSEEHVNLQRIVWRENPSDELKDYIILTVVYGTASASYLATRSMNEVGIRCRDEYPIVAQVIEEDMFVDDAVTGRDKVEELKDVKDNMVRVMQRFGFKLHKFKSNCAELLGIESYSQTHQFTEPGTKMLGITWNCEQDVFSFQIENLSPVPKFTKRGILADISSIFDPLGLIGIATITLKIFMQQLWIHANGWDDEIGADLQEYWRELRSEIVNLNKVKVPRKINLPNAVMIELHGFADASELAYGCCVYLRAVSAGNVVQTRLIASKSRVAPIKKQSIPRLELSAASLLSELLDKISKALRLDIKNKFYWTDSTIVLHWVATVPNKLQTYVANRVAKIQELTDNSEWRHVPGIENPADLLSRSVKPNLIANEKVWWEGPEWLKLEKSLWPNLDLNFVGDPLECKKPKVLCATVQHDLFAKFSYLTKMQRSVAYCIRFANNCQAGRANRVVGPLTINELNDALTRLVKLSQFESFPSEIKTLTIDRTLKMSSRIVSLAPFIDDLGILRVGGRLKHANVPIDVKHPILLQGSHRLARLLFEREHKRLLHAAPQLLLYTTRENYWVLGGRDLARNTVHSCLKCFRFSANNISPVMGNLPSPRIDSSLPFSHVGTDFAGPFQLKDRMGRGAKMYKAYVCLFICYATKAVHLEVVSSLSTEAFIAALRRFVSRRGKPSNIYSDNGTNYVGAARELGEFIKGNASQISDQCVSDNIKWHFTPPRSPHFGGLWERAVQSVKHHMRRVMTNHTFTYEHFVTILVQIEAVLNSRPLSPLSPDPHDLRALTPAHLLLGRSLTSLPEHDVISIPENRRSMFQQLQAIKQHFWTRWSKEYVSGLQERQKWQQSKGEIKIDALVLVKDDQLPPMQWRLGRVVKVFHGSDNIARVAEIKTESGIIKRCFSKICSLPDID